MYGIYQLTVFKWVPTENTFNTKLSLENVKISYKFWQQMLLKFMRYFLSEKKHACVHKPNRTSDFF